MLQNELMKVFKEAEQMTLYYTATLTDRFMLGIWGDPDSSIFYQEEIQLVKLLELRVFNKDMEIMVRRGDISEPFKKRVLDDREGIADCFDEIQLLDIDRKRSSSAGHVKTTGGGKYKLPEGIYKMKNPGLIVRHYFDRYSETGIAFISDWRCVGFEDLSEVDQEIKRRHV